MWSKWTVNVTLVILAINVSAQMSGGRRSYLESNPLKVPEQRLLRSYRSKDKPEGFPLEYRRFALFGQQYGRSGRPTHFYSEVGTFCVANK